MLLYTKSKLLNSGQLRMAQLPQTEDIYVTPGLWVPLVKTKNLLILPGVPILFKKMIDNWFEVELSKLSAKKELILIPKIRKSVKTIWKESDIAEKLSALQSEALECEIAFGSYPKLFEDGSTFVIISISGPDSFSDKIFQYATKVKNLFEGEYYNI
jgi:molybdopterin-biosynthesis enzyme MoeA-like protein